MKEKLIVGSIAIIVLIGAIFTVMITSKYSKEEKDQKRIIVSENPVTDECTIEYKIAIEEQEVEEVNSGEEKISSNAQLILKKYYKECEHTINEYAEMLPELVNMTQDEVSEQFKDWELIGFSPKEVTLFQEIKGTCGEHFKIKEENGKVIIYKVLEDGAEQIYEKTEICTEYLPETDLFQIQSETGIQVFGKEELNKVLEDFE